jgi:hypothetical protein
MNRNPDWEGPSRTGNWLLGAVRRNPEGLLLLAAGCALMMRSGGPSRRASSGNDRVSSRYDQPHRYPDNAFSRSGSVGAASGLGQGVSQAADRAKEYAAEIKDSVSETTTSYASSVSDYAEEARRSVTEHSGRIAREAQSTLQDTINRVLRDQPLAIAVLGLAAGAAVAAVLPASELERLTLGPAGEKVSDAAMKAGGQLKEATAKAGERLVSAAEERGLNAGGLKEVARDVAGTFGSAFSGEQKESGDLAAGPNSIGSSGQTSRTSGASGIRDQARQPLSAAPPKGRPVDQVQGSVGSGTQNESVTVGSGLSAQRGTSSSSVTQGGGLNTSRNQPGESVEQKSRGTR